LDANEWVKANVNLGGTISGGTITNIVPGGNDFRVEEAGIYTITLTFQLAQGAVQNSFSWSYELTGTIDLPENMYMIGYDFGNWYWADDGVVELTLVLGSRRQNW